ncbi:hypothetical protein M885DRAFT_617234 [Pelagophyceae sp. CCMP2097]|nr:hypothetical protein M885DRAFT_617234 [Pelagophyceae sp. CCMP2097]
MRGHGVLRAVALWAMLHCPAAHASAPLTQTERHAIVGVGKFIAMTYGFYAAHAAAAGVYADRAVTVGIEKLWPAAATATASTAAAATATASTAASSAVAAKKADARDVFDDAALKGTVKHLETRVDASFLAADAPANEGLER